MTRERPIGNSFLAAPPRRLDLPEGFRFSRGEHIAPFSIVYETYGRLNHDRSNAILVCHALSVGAHAAGRYKETDPRPGWWDGMIGYGKCFDIERYFVMCVNYPGSCFGTTGPADLDPERGRPYGSRYPWMTVEDMVEAGRLVLDHLGIERVLTVVGGSLGGMQALMWAARHPERLRSLICLAAGAHVPVEGVGWHTIGRKIIEADPRFQGGDYYGDPRPLRGLEVARMVGHMTYMSLEALETKFGRRRRHDTRQFEIDSYFEYQGQKFARQFDANSYIRIQAAMDDMDLVEQYGSMAGAFASSSAPALLVSFDTDWLFPPAAVREVARAMSAAGCPVELVELSSPHGHDAFLIDFDLITPPIQRFLARVESADEGPRDAAPKGA